MGHVTKRTSWCDIDIDTTVGRVFLQQRWLYIWALQPSTPPLSPWTSAEQQAFHDHADRRIWGIWSNRVRLAVRGMSGLARQFSRQGVTLNLDIQRVTTAPHWTVTVTKIPRGSFVQSSTDWVARTIQLDTEDLTLRHHQQDAVTHEFGHALGNTYLLRRGDEYRPTSLHVRDANSIMNLGNKPRDRHFRMIIEQLNTMIPSTTFSIMSIR